MSKSRVIGIVAALLGVTLVAALSLRRTQERLPRSYLYDVEKYRAAEQDQPLPFAQTARYPLALREPRAVAIGADGQLVVAGDRVIVILDGTGAEIRRLPLEDEPRCVTVDGAALYVGFATRIEVYDTHGARQAAWESLGEQAYLTGLTIVNHELFAADYGQRVVWRFDAEGRLRGRIARPAADDGFVLPSPTFDVAAGSNEVWVVNSGRRRIEAYSMAGQRGRTWGRSSMEIDGFCGCCNPTQLAVMPDGRFVTSEKGLPRVKLYRADGTFEALVAGSEQLGATADALDVAVDAAGRIVVLDVADRSVRVYEENSHDG